jgi:hypothetical protein
VKPLLVNHKITLLGTVIKNKTEITSVYLQKEKFVHTALSTMHHDAKLEDSSA